MPIRLKDEEFARLVDQAVASLPDEFRPYLENLTVDVEPRPSRELLASMKLPRRDRLLGLYQGVPLTEKSVSAPLDWPERIVIFKQNVEAFCRTRPEVVREVRRTVLHEVGHHFGLDEEELRRLGYQ